MNLEERIEAVWKEYRSRRYYTTERETDDAEDEFKSGYLAAIQESKKTPHVVDEDHAYGDQEVYYGVLVEADYVGGEQVDSVVKLWTCVSEDSVYLSDNHGDLRDVDEFDFVVGPFGK